MFDPLPQLATTKQSSSARFMSPNGAGAARSSTQGTVEIETQNPESAEDLLLKRWRAGDQAAGDELVRLCKPALRSFFRRRTSENVDELIQRTLVACIQAVDRFEGRSSFKSFLLGIAHKQFLMILRSNRPREIPAALHPHGDDNPSQLLATKEDMRTVAAALNDTSPPFRRVLEMFYWDDLSVEEIARALDLPAGTVKSRLARGRSMIKARIVEAARPLGEGMRQVRKDTSTEPRKPRGARQKLREPTLAQGVA